MQAAADTAKSLSSAKFERSRDRRTACRIESLVYEYGTVVMTRTADARRVEEQVSLTALFVGFLKVSLLGFGGGLVWARRIVVERQRWVDDREFAEILTLCQFMPGPNIVGITTCVGSRLRGPVGAVAAVAGFILIPWIIGLSLGGLYLQFRSPRGPPEHPRRAFRGRGRPDDRDRDPAADAAPQSPHGVALCRPGLHRHGGHQIAAARRIARLGAAQHRHRRYRKRKSIMKSPSASLVLAAHLALLSSISFGGFPTVLPDVRNLVTANGWVTDQEFANFFAISQVVPGPNMILMMSFVGLKVGGLPGAILSALATFGPPCLMYYTSYRLWDRFRDRPWQQIVRLGLAPLTIGLVIAGGYVMARAADTGWQSAAITAAAVVLMLATRINPLWILVTGGVLGGLGLV